MDTSFDVDEKDAELAAALAAQGVEYVFASFIDIVGRAKSKCVPIEHLLNSWPGMSATRRAAWGTSGR